MEENRLPECFGLINEMTHSSYLGVAHVNMRLRNCSTGCKFTKECTLSALKKQRDSGQKA